MFLSTASITISNLPRLPQETNEYSIYIVESDQNNVKFLDWLQKHKKKESQCSKKTECISCIAISKTLVSTLGNCESGYIPISMSWHKDLQIFRYLLVG